MADTLLEFERQDHYISWTYAGPPAALPYEEIMMKMSMCHAKTQKHSFWGQGNLLHEGIGILFFE